MTNPDAQYLTVAELAARFRVSKMTIYRQIHDGTIPAIRIGRSFRIPEHVTGTHGVAVVASGNTEVS